MALEIVLVVKVGMVMTVPVLVMPVTVGPVRVGRVTVGRLIPVLVTPGTLTVLRLVKVTMIVVPGYTKPPRNVCGATVTRAVVVAVETETVAA